MIVSIKSKPPASANRALKIWQSHLYYRSHPHRVALLLFQFLLTFSFGFSFFFIT